MEAANNLATDSLFVNNGKVLTSSLDVADSFGKKHKNVLRDIQHLVDSGEVGGLKFEPTNYLDSQGRSKPCFSMTRDGFILVVMGYKTKAALGIKQRYIDAYNAMEARLREVDGTVPVQVDAVTAALEAAGLRKAVTELRLVTSSSGLSTDQIRIMLARIGDRVTELDLPSKGHGLIKGALKATFLIGIPKNQVTFKDIKQSDFDAALQFISRWTN